MTLTCITCGKTCLPSEMVKRSADSVRNRCKPCQAEIQHVTRQRRAEREAEAARLDRERSMAMRADPAWASPRTVVGEGTYKPQPWNVRDGALAYRSVPSRGIGV